MAATTFQERLARIEKQQPPTPEFTPARFAQPRKEKRKLKAYRHRGAGQNLVSMATGGLLGGLIGVLVQGAAIDQSPWGPGTQFNEILGLAGLGGLLVSLPMLLVAVYMRQTRPGFFFFSAAYAVAVIAVSLV